MLGLAGVVESECGLPRGDHHIRKIGVGNVPILMGSARFFWKRDSQLLKGLGEKDLLAIKK
jgi:hypothetical protein